MGSYGRMGPQGSLSAMHFKAIHPAPLHWTVKNRMRWSYIKGWLLMVFAMLFSKLTRIPTILAELRGVGYHFTNDYDRAMYEVFSQRLFEAENAGDPRPIEVYSARLEEVLRKRVRVDYKILSRQLVTDAGVAFLVDDWDANTTDITNMNNHASGTGAVAENVTDTALGAESTTITDRVAGTKSQPAANQLRTVGTQSYTGAGAITEHGIFSIITESTGVLWDRSVFAAINVGNGDSIQWTYTCTINSGG